MKNKQNSLKWCVKLKDGLKITEPDGSLAKSYLNEAKLSLRRAEKDFNDKDLLWATVITYYAEYYALYSFLQKIGIKCENHFCSILIIEKLLGKERVKTINNHKEKRIDAQYYMRIGKENEVKIMLQESKIFVTEFDNFISNLINEEVEDYRKKFKSLIEEQKL